MDDVAVRVVLETVGGDEGKKNRLAGVCLGAECIKARRQYSFFLCGDLELILAVLHLAKVDGLVLTVDQKIDLSSLLGTVSLTAPRASQRLDTGDAESLLDLPQVAKAQHLERESAPSVV